MLKAAVNDSASRRRFLLPMWLVLFIIVLTPIVHGTAHGQVTVVHRTVADDLAQLAANPLAALVPDDTATDVPALALYWTQDTSGWFPVWQLQVQGDPALLPNDAVVGSDGLATVTLHNANPTAGRTYTATLSYAGDEGALAYKVYDATDNRTVFAGGLAVPTRTVSLQGLAGDTTAGYIPVGTVWAVGSGDGQLPFVVSSQFTRRDEPAVLRLLTPEPLPSGQFRVSVRHAGTETTVATVTPEKRETFIPLPLDILPWGTTTLHLDYVDDGTVLLQDTVAVTLGLVDFRMEPVVAQRERGTLETSFTMQSSVPLDEPLLVNVRATIEALQWNDTTRRFDHVPYAKDVLLTSATVDLSDGTAAMAVELPLPDTAGNWQVKITPEMPARLTARTHGETRWFSTFESAELEPGDTYRVVILPDTQYFAANYPDTFLRMTDWITANAARLGIAAVWHVGDITDDNSPRQWDNAHAGMSLLNDVVPYVFAMGNHDMVAPDGSAMRGHTRINTYFPVAMAERYSHVAGTMKPNEMQNHYALLSLAGDDYLVISLEFWPPDEALAWANEIAKQYPNHRLVLLTHSYLSSGGNLALVNTTYPITKDPNTTVNHGLAMWELFMRLQTNSFMVISGHVTSEKPVVPYRVGRTVHGVNVPQLLFNWQNQPQGGNGWLGIMTFHPDETVDVTVYSPYLDQWADTTDNNGFTSNVRIDLPTGAVQRIPFVDRSAGDGL